MNVKVAKERERWGRERKRDWLIKDDFQFKQTFLQQMPDNKVIH